MTRRRALAGGILVATLLAFPATADAVLGGTNGRIVFVSGRGGPANNDSAAKIYLRTVTSSSGAGSASPAVTSGSGQYRHPTWSPDRRKIAYARHDAGAGVQDVLVHNLVTGQITTISNTANVSDRPAWSPDGTRIAFETTSGANTDVIVYTIATGATLNMTTGGFPNTLPATKPAWSPDSQLLYYARGMPGGAAPGSDADILVEPASNLGAAVLAVPDSEASEFQPSISPDGSQICFTLSIDGFGPSADVWVAPLATPASQTRISDNVGSGAEHGDYNCTWSPDGTLITYVRGTFTSGDLVMEASDDSSPNAIVLENTANHFDGNPDWAPDGRPRCEDLKVQTVRGSSVFVTLKCSDRGPAYERTGVSEAIRDGPSDGSLGPVQQGSPSRVRYTPGSDFTGTDTFTFRGVDTFGPGPPATARVEVLLPGRCGNFQRGTAGPDTLVGTRFGDLLRGLGGEDELRGLAGADCLEGGNGSDELEGGGGPDLLEGGSGRNQYAGGAGNDQIRARNGRTELIGCGKGRRDRATVDFGDVVAGCEIVSRG
jgi:Ca2+-binding RTX toxin-like protein